MHGVAYDSESGIFGGSLGPRDFSNSPLGVVSDRKRLYTEFVAMTPFSHLGVNSNFCCKQIKKLTLQSESACLSELINPVPKSFTDEKNKTELVNVCKKVVYLSKEAK